MKGNAMNNFEPGIYLEVKPASSIGIPLGNNKHAYLVYRKADGSSEVIRGGLGKFGTLSVETGKSLEESKDALDEGEKPNTRPSRKLNIPSEKLDKTWSKMRDKAEEIGKTRLPYNANPIGADQTSNSVVRAALDAAEVPVESALPDGVATDILPGIEDNLKDDLKNNPPNPIEGEIGGTDDQKPTPSGSVDPSDNGPSGHDDGADDQGSDNTSGNGQNQSTRTRDDADDLENASPENRKFMDDLMRSGDAVDDIMLKKPQDLTEGEFTELKKRMIALPAGAEQDRLDKAATAFLENRFGDGPAEHDAVGRMIDPQPVRPAPKTPGALRTVDGRPLEAGLKHIGQTILKDAKNNGLADAIKNLQGGINFMKDAKQKTPMPFPALKQDGVFGAKTRNGLRQALVTLGQPKVREGMALGRFNDFARQGQRKGFDDLADATENSMAPLFRDPGRPAEKVEAVTLQETLNDLGRKQVGDTFKPLKLDGDIGPRTKNAFGQLTGAVGPERVTKRFGEFLGFF